MPLTFFFLLWERVNARPGNLGKQAKCSDSPHSVLRSTEHTREAIFLLMFSLPYTLFLLLWCSDPISWVNIWSLPLIINLKINMEQLQNTEISFIKFLSIIRKIWSMLHICIFYFENIVLINPKVTALKVSARLKWLHFFFWRSRIYKCKSLLIDPLFIYLKYGTFVSVFQDNCCALYHSSPSHWIISHLYGMHIWLQLTYYRMIIGYFVFLNFKVKLLSKQTFCREYLSLYSLQNFHEKLC